MHPYGRYANYLILTNVVNVTNLSIETKEGDKDIKDRYCLKHPGYQKLFFCKNCVKGICEKCIPIHSNCDVVTVLLESQKLHRSLDQFKTEFSGLSKNWEEMYYQFHNKKENFDYEVDQTCKEIDTHFTDLIKKLEESKKKYIEAFKLRAKDEMKEFLDEYDKFSAYYANIKQKNNEIDHLDGIYEKSSDFDLVKESSIMQNDQMFKNFCPEYNNNLDEFKTKYDQIQSKSNYSFHFSTATKDEEIINSVHKNIKIKMKIEENETEPVEESKGSPDSIEKQKRPKGDTGSPYPINFRQLYKIDKSRRKLIVYDFSSSKTSKTTYTEPIPDDHNNQEMHARHMSQITRGVLSPDSKSCCIDTGDIFVFGASETKFSDCFYTVDGTELEECQNIPVKRKKISCVA